MATKTRNNLPSPDASAEVVAHIGAGTRVVGRLSGQEDLRVHGTIEGSVRLGATLFVEPEGVLLAEVMPATSSSPAPSSATSTPRAPWSSPPRARVIGDIRSPRVSVEPGAAFRGAISMEPVDAEELAAEASAARSYGNTRSAPARALTERAVQANGNPTAEVRRSAPARQQQQAVRLPPRRAQAFTAAAPQPRAWAPREPVRPAPPPALPPAFRPAFGTEDTIIVQHPAIRSSDDRSRRRAEALPAADHGHAPSR
jgi:cytoskeletal protein CcmA (bactofilin family)